jgi:hypothetical protein
MESSTRQWIDLAVGEARSAIETPSCSILEDVLFANMVGLVTGVVRPGRSVNQLELAARTVLRDDPHEPLPT